MHAVLRSCSPSSASMSRIPSWLAFNPFGTFRFNQMDEPLDETRKPRETIPEEDGGVISPHGSPTWLPTRAQGEKLKARTRPPPRSRGPAPPPGTDARARSHAGRPSCYPRTSAANPSRPSARACTDTALSGRRGVPSSSGGGVTGGTGRRPHSQWPLWSITVRVAAAHANEPAVSAGQAVLCELWPCRAPRPPARGATCRVAAGVGSVGDARTHTVVGLPLSKK